MHVMLETTFRSKVAEVARISVCVYAREEDIVEGMLTLLIALLALHTA